MYYSKISYAPTAQVSYFLLIMLIQTTNITQTTSLDYLLPRYLESIVFAEEMQFPLIVVN